MILHVISLAWASAAAPAGTAPSLSGTPPVTVAAEKALLAVREAWHRAYAGNDEAALEKLLADKFTVVLSTGNQADRATLLANAAKHAPILTLTSRDPQVRRYGNTAVVTSLVLEQRGPARLEFRVTDVMVMDRGGWKVAASHWSRTGGELAEVSLAPAALDKIAGSYTTPRGVTLRLTRHGSRMRVTEPGGQATDFVSLADNLIMAPSNKVRWIFISDASGAVTHAVIANQFTLTPLTRVSGPESREGAQ